MLPSRIFDIDSSDDGFIHSDYERRRIEQWRGECRDNVADSRYTEQQIVLLIDEGRSA